MILINTPMCKTMDHDGAEGPNQHEASAKRYGWLGPRRANFGRNAQRNRCSIAALIPTSLHCHWHDT